MKTLLQPPIKISKNYQPYLRVVVLDAAVGQPGLHFLLIGHLGVEQNVDSFFLGFKV